MRLVIVGLGNQGRKRRAVAGGDVVGIVDPAAQGADFTDIRFMPLDHYDAALVSTPDDAKIEILTWLLSHGKHVLVEKPLWVDDASDLHAVAAAAQSGGAVCYTAYNHRFEPHFVAMRDLLNSGELGQPYLCRMFYGNGTARDVRNSVWRDQGAGILTDLGSHLLDTLMFWFGDLDCTFNMIMANRFENRAPDHVSFAGRGSIAFELEAAMISWRNHFTCDVYAEKGSVHIDSLCKWGPSTLTRRRRVLPSGRPPEQAVTLVQSDPTWELEYNHFKTLCAQGGPSNIDNDIEIHRHLTALATQLG
jgi:predicted dehydrogenase